MKTSVPASSPIPVSSAAQLPARNGYSSFSFMICLSTVSAVVAAVHSWNDPWTLCYLITLYVLYMLLIWCIYIYDRLPKNSEKKETLKVPIWSLATAINLVTIYRVSTFMNLAMQCVLWGMAALISLSGFYFLFIYKTKCQNPNGGANCAAVDVLVDSKV